MTSQPQPIVLLIDDDPDFLAVSRLFLHRQGYLCVVATDWRSAQQALAATSPVAILLDRNLGNNDGMALIPEVQRLAPNSCIILMTSNAPVDLVVGAIKAGAFDFVGKPIDEGRLLASLAKAVEHQRLRTKVQDLAGSKADEDNFESIVGKSAPIRTVYDTIRNVAHADVSVMIAGESGTGKELVARAIHNRSNRKTGPFVAINMAALPEDLIESILFGHEKGAFTGADKTHPGACGEAESGTLFLDEITEMPIDLQPKLLRFLQERTYRPVGARQDKTANVRVLSATNRDPLSEVKAGRFRLDLYYRLNVVPIYLPALRDRAGDVELLALHFLSVLSKRYNKSFTQFTPEALHKLNRCPWPGNVRQLYNTVERIVVLHTGPIVTLDMLPPDLSWSLTSEASALIKPDAATKPGASVAPQASPLEPATDADQIIPLEELERRAILGAVKACQGAAAVAAAKLGISQSTLYRKLKEYEESV
jgi:two-component system, repressor protein LuxO